MEFRRHWPAGQVFDVDFSTFIRAPKDMVRRIVDHFDLPVPPDLEDRLERRLAEMPRHKHGVHRYTLERFGLTSRHVEDVGAEYHRYFDVTPEDLPRA